MFIINTIIAHIIIIACVSFRLITDSMLLIVLCIKRAECRPSQAIGLTEYTFLLSHKRGLLAAGRCAQVGGEV
jgi:hypothetical protein